MQEYIGPEGLKDQRAINDRLKVLQQACSIAVAIRELESPLQHVEVMWRKII